MRKTTLLALTVVVAAATACGSNATAVEWHPTAIPSDSPREPATPRGIAALILNYLDTKTVTSVMGGYNGSGEIDAAAKTTDPTLTITVSVFPSEIAKDFQRTLHCSDPGPSEPEVVACHDGTYSLGLVRYPHAKPDRPVLLGDYFDPARGSVILQVRGADTPANRDLALAMLKDPMLGLTTAAALNAAGEKIPDVKGYGSYVTPGESTDLR